MLARSGGLLLWLAIAHGAPHAEFTLLKSNAECLSNDDNLGDVTSLQQCADKCAAHRGCNFFISGKSDKAGRCWVEFTN